MDLKVRITNLETQPMQISGYLRKMEYIGLDPVTYYLVLGNYKTEDLQKKDKTKNPPSLLRSPFSLNSLIGQKIRLHFSGEIRCVDCGRATSKSYKDGSCYVCFTSLAKHDHCILNPVTCKFHVGGCREPDWGKINCFKKHTVYLANTSGVKVGITKENPITNRWIDQGAMYGIEFFEVESRKDAGIIENEIRKYISDKTSWQKMISQDSVEINLSQKKEELFEKMSDRLQDIQKKLVRNEEIKIHYPILNYPKKIKSYKIDPKNPIDDILIGIKGQYLLFENIVFNIRSNSGFFVNFES